LHQTKNDYFIYNGQIKEIIPWLKKTNAQKIDFPRLIGVLKEKPR